MRLADKVAVITGAASGIGQASARLFAANGARLLLVDREAALLEDLATELRAQGHECLVRASDVAAPGSADADAGAALEAWGRIDVLLTAAGISPGGTATTTSIETWQAVMRTNVEGTWLWARAVIPAMQARRAGSIITIASQLARAGGRNNIAYITSKGAILAMTKTMALDYAPDGIRVNALLPGAIETPLLRRSFGRAADPDAAREASRARHPLGRLGRPEEVADAALYLAGDAAAFTTGLELAVDGGWLAG
ncbi:SDR family oxidoreductase [Roseomonas hellenica]|uniref:SDR family oxidoreductase n=1 Tax=Plastoroseomonas hellenica TaxID=2687306 RepID=A0ABS5ES80_9PROT|nr:SDR family oxidoreductase [Plastoroseomonas hellenica]MBR0663156.1 SDR family oxidoreductase [Plastoroseomonas hellenica]